MKTLYRKFIAATLVILAISILLSFLLTNWVYMASTKGKIDRHNVVIAEEIANGLEHMHSSGSTYETYLNSMSKLGYQLYIVSESGKGEFFGQPFNKTDLPEEAEKVLTDQKVYHGMDSFAGQFLMMGHFSNDLENTVGVPFTVDNQNYGLFLRPDNKLLFSDIHMIFAW